MNWLLLCMVIFVTFAALMLGVGHLLKTDRAELDRLLAADELAQAVARVDPSLHWCPTCGHRHYGQGPLHCDGLPRAGRFPVEYLPGPPFAGATDRGRDFKTGPLLLLSDKMAAEVALERDVRAMIEAGEEKIPPRWRS